MVSQLQREFTITVEVIPPSGPNPGSILSSLKALKAHPFYGFSVATNPVARAKMSALALCSIIQKEIGKPATLHCTTRDHNRLSLRGLLWGAGALGIKSVLVASGDFVSLKDQGVVTAVNDIDVFELIGTARDANLDTGVAFDPFFERKDLPGAIRRLERKVDAGAQFAVTQPIYDEEAATDIADASSHLHIPIIAGILPLRGAKHAVFLHDKVAGIVIPRMVRQRMTETENPVGEGVALSKEILDLARDHFAGACIMPPFNHYEILHEVLG